jgi:hypothetical protein
LNSPLQKSPQGLLESFALKTLGEAPKQFGEVVSPVVDVLDFYTTELMFSAQSPSTTVGAFNQTISATLSLTMLRSVGGTFIEGAAAGTFMHWSLGVRVRSTTIVAWLASGSFAAIGIGASRAFGVTLPKPIIVPSGSELVGFFTSDAAGADHTFRLNWLTTAVNALGL